MDWIPNMPIWTNKEAVKSSKISILTSYNLMDNLTNPNGINLKFTYELIVEIFMWDCFSKSIERKQMKWQSAVDFIRIAHYRNLEPYSLSEIILFCFVTELHIYMNWFEFDQDRISYAAYDMLHTICICKTSDNTKSDLKTLKRKPQKVSGLSADIL